jgi:hypothetical protein
MKNINGNSEVELTRTDLLELLRLIRDLLEDLEYVTVPVWKAVTSKMIAAFVRGRGMPPSYIQVVEERLQAFSTRSRTPEATWWADWKFKSGHVLSESHRKKRKPSQDFLEFLFPRLAVPIDDFGFVMVDGRGGECALVTLSGFVHVVASYSHLEKLGLEILNAAAEICRSRIVNTTDFIDEEYELTAVDDWTDQLAADAWLLRPPLEEDTE